MTQDNNARIDELMRLSRERVLTKEEEETRKLLRQEGARQTPGDTLVQYSDGTCITLEESAKNRDKSADPSGTV